LIRGDYAVAWIMTKSSITQLGFFGAASALDLADDDVEEPEERAARQAAEAAKCSEELQKKAIHRKEARWTNYSGVMRFRVPKPCKYAALYAKRLCVNCDNLGISSTIPEGETLCRTMIPGGAYKNHMDGVSISEERMCNQELSGCHNHEVHSCIYVHPDEPQWADACSGRLDVLACKEWCEKKSQGMGCVCGNRLVFCSASHPGAMRNQKQRGAASRGGGGGNRGGGGGNRGGGAWGTPNRFAAALAPHPEPQQSRRSAPASRFGEVSSSEDEGDRSAW